MAMELRLLTAWSRPSPSPSPSPSLPCCSLHLRPPPAAPHVSCCLSSAVSCSSLPALPSPVRSVACGSYSLLLTKYPLATKCVTAALVYFLADATSQVVKIALSGENAFHWDIRRTARMVAAGLLLSGTTLHLWFNLMSEVLPFGDVRSILKKTALGQIVYGPIFTALFFSFNAYVQGETTNEVVFRLKRDLVPALKKGFMYWTICDFLTFTYVPVHLQALANNLFAYMWTIYLTYTASSKKVES